MKHGSLVNYLHCTCPTAIIEDQITVFDLIELICDIKMYYPNVVLPPKEVLYNTVLL